MRAWSSRISLLVLHGSSFSNDSLLMVVGCLLALKTEKNRGGSLLLSLSWICLLIMESADDAESDPPSQG